MGYCNENGLTWSVDLTQGDYKSMIALLADDTALANGCTDVAYYWKDTATESVLYYKCAKN